MQERVRREFDAVRRRVEEFEGRSGMWVEVDAAGTVEEVAERIWGVASAPGVSGEVKRLWV